MLYGVALIATISLVAFLPPMLKGKKHLPAAASLAFSQSNELPIKIGDSLFLPLREQENMELERRLANRLNSVSKYRGLIQNKKLAVGLVDLQDPLNVKFAQINGNEMMYAASLPKIAILLSAMDAFEKGELKETKVIRDDLQAMITVSNNQASTRMIDRLGYEKIESVLTDSRYELYDKDFGGGLWVGKRYAASGERHPDPIKGLSHAATASQVCRFYYLLSMGKLVSYERSRQMLEIMDDPALHHKFVFSLDRAAPRARVFRKSGSWKNYHSDSALVWGKDPRRRYILVALVEDAGGEQIVRDMVNVVEDVLDL